MKIWIDNGSFGTHSGSFHINNHKNTETSTTVNGWHFTAMNDCTIGMQMQQWMTCRQSKFTLSLVYGEATAKMVGNCMGLSDCIEKG